MLGKINKPFFIAEISSNHNGNILNAIRLIKIAKKNGADAVKLQTYTPDSMTVNSRKKYFIIKKGLWKGFSLWDLSIMEKKLVLKYLARLLMTKQLIF